MTIEINQANGNLNQTAIKVGDHVRLKGSDEYLGKVTDEQVFRFVRITDKEGNHHWIPDDVLELAPRLTPDEAWAELPYLVLAQLNKALNESSSTMLYAGEHSAIRHECYKLLGGAGIKVTDKVKERVRKAIQRIALAMDIELA